MKRLFIRLSTKILYLFVKTNVTPEDTADLIVSDDVPVIYVLKTKSITDYLVLSRETHLRQLPSTLDPLKLHNHSSNIPPIFSAHNRNKKQLNYTPKHLPELINYLSSNPDQSIQLIPVHIRWGQSPDKENSWFKALFSDAWVQPGSLRKLSLILIHGRKVMVSFNQPILLNSALIDEPSQTRATRKVIRLCRMHFRRQEEAMIGPDLSHRRTILENVISQPSVLNTISELQATKGGEKLALQDKAYKYANEIASDYSYSNIRFLDILLTHIWNSIYNGIDIKGVERLKQNAGANEIVYVPCHRSHVDYLLLSYVLFSKGLATPYVAAGINLNIPVVGNILRKGGAFFMRRAFKDNPLYSAVFGEYLSALIRRGHPIKYFIEGGRSRTGRLLPPKYGMLNMTVKAAAEPKQKPVVFIPVYIGYEKIMEMDSYIGELYGKEKKSESVFDVINLRKRLKEDFGRVYVRFGEPVPLNQFMDDTLPSWKNDFTSTTSGNQTESTEQKENALKGTAALGTHLIARINDCANINPINLIALVITTSSTSITDRVQLEKQVDVYRRLFVDLQARVFPEATVTDLDANAMINWAIQLKHLSEETHPLGNLIHVNQSQRLSMTYYRNNSVHQISFSALIACILLNNRHVTERQLKTICSSMYPYLKAELFLSWSVDELDAVIDAHLDILEGLGLLERKSNKVSAPDANTDAYQSLRLLANVLRETIERYYIVISLLEHQGSGTIDKKELETLAQMVAQRLSMLHFVNAPDYYDKTVFREFIKTLTKQGILFEDEQSKLCVAQPLTLAQKHANRMINMNILNQIDQITTLEHEKLLSLIKQSA